jgi:hypothetical protein
MSIRTIAIAVALTLAPALAHASCSDRGHQAQSCASGTAWDSNLQTCVKRVNS